MYTRQQQQELAAAIMAADVLGQTLIDVTFIEGGPALVRTAPRFLRKPELQLFDLSDIYAVLEAGIEMGRREAERDIEQRLDATYDEGYRTSQDEGAQELENLLDEIELEFGEAGRRFTQPYRNESKVNPDDANFDGEAAIPQGTFHSDVNLDGDNDSVQPGPDSGGDTNVGEAEFDPYIYVRGSVFGYEFDFKVEFTDTGLAISGTVMGIESVFGYEFNFKVEFTDTGLAISGTVMDIEFDLVVTISPTAIAIGGTVMGDPFNLTISLVPLSQDDDEANMGTSMSDILREFVTA